MEKVKIDEDVAGSRVGGGLVEFGSVVEFGERERCGVWERCGERERCGGVVEEWCRTYEVKGALRRK